jgi:uncharacterized cupredoxin-like copper-binding protein
MLRMPQAFATLAHAGGGIACSIVMEVQMNTNARPRLLRRIALGAGVAAGALALAACSAAATPKPTGGTVDVALQEWAILPTQTSVAAGPVTFNAKNTGPKEVHEFVVIKTDLDPGKLPVDADGSVDENALNSPGEIEEFDPGQTESKTLTLDAGKYVFICNIVQDLPDGKKQAHYKLGMFSAFTVK